VSLKVMVDLSEPLPCEALQNGSLLVWRKSAEAATW